MFGGKFSLTQFSLKQEISVLYIRVDFSDLLNCIAGAGKDIVFSTNFTEALKSKIDAVNALLTQMDVADYLKVTTIGELNLLFSINAEDELNSHVHVGKIMQNNVDFEEELKASVYVGKEISHVVDFSDELLSKVHVGKIMSNPAWFVDALNVIVESGILEVQSAVIQVTIPPGGELRINSDNDAFSVTLNQENIYYLYSGDWITFDRDTVSISIDSGSGGKLTGQIMYNERWL